MNDITKAEVNLFIAICYSECAARFTHAAKLAVANDHGYQAVLRLIALSELMTQYSAEYEERSRLS